MSGLHTATPWRIVAWPSAIDIDTANGNKRIAKMVIQSNSDDPRDKSDYRVDRIEAEANAAFIVKAVNCHDELVAALKTALREVKRKFRPQEFADDGDPTKLYPHEIIERALAKVEASPWVTP